MTREERYSAAEKLKDDGDLAGAVAALETRMVDASGSGLGGMRVWAHDSAVAHVVLLVPHGPRFGDLNRGASRSGYEWP